MSQNTGTLIASTIRPNDSLDKISVVFANEAKGGHHAYAQYSDMTSAQINFPDRFIFGMLATVYNDTLSLNNGTYVLKYNKHSTDPSDSLNWELSTGSVDNVEWQNSVISRTSSIPTVKVTGDRYLIIGSTGGTSFTMSENTWLGHVDNIAEYDSTIPTWNFYIPTQGTTVRVDNEISILYKYNGTYSQGGVWVKEYINQVYTLTASSIDGINYIATANLVGYYKPSIFYINFMTSSVGPNATININNLGTASILKVTGNNLLNISTNDFNTSVIYQLVYDGTNFQVPLASSVNIIGPAEFGNTYSNGLYSDFTVNTPIGTPIDRFNQILAALVPPSAPNLQSINGYSSKLQTAKLTFPLSALTNYYNIANSGYGSVGVDGQWSLISSSSGYKRLGVYAATSSNTDKNVLIYGVLNYDVATNSATPIPAYNSTYFGNGYSGFLYMNINGLTVSTLSLTASYGATDTSLGLNMPGLSVSSATASKFPSGALFNTFYNRSGLWYIPATSMYGPFSYNSLLGMTANSYGLTRGYNYVTVTQVTPTNTYALSKVEFILDDDVQSVSVANPNAGGAFSTTIFGATKSISGIVYYTSVSSLIYTSYISKAYGGVYSDSNAAITIADISTGGIGTPPPTGVFASQLPLSGVGLTSSNYSAYLTITKNYTSLGNNVRRIGDSVALYINSVSKPLLSNGSSTFTPANGASASLFGLVFDNFNAGPSQSFEGFDDESYRLITGSYSTVFTISTGGYVNSVSLQGTNDLQVYNGRLQYPSLNFSTMGTSTASNYNYGNTFSNYSICSGTRYYYRWFRNTSVNSNNFGISIIASGSIIAGNSILTTYSNQFQIEIKLPGVTSWCDVSRATSFSNTDHDGIYNAAGFTGVPAASVNLIGTLFALTLPSLYNTSASSNYVVVRVTAPYGWTGYIESITFNMY